MEQPKAPAVLRFVLVGETGVGKTAIGRRYIEGTFSTEAKPTIGVDFFVKELPRPIRAVKLQIWDTGGQERFRTVTRSFYRGTAVALVVYDPSKRSSFEALEKWVEEVRNFAPQECIIFIIRNKIDMVTQQTGEWVAITEALEWCNQKGLKHFGLSAATGVDVNDVMERAVTEAMAVYKEVEPIKLVLNDSCQTHGCCCTIIGAPPEHFKHLRESFQTVSTPKPRGYDVLIPEGFEFRQDEKKQLRERVSVDLMAAAKLYLHFYMKVEKKYPRLFVDEEMLRCAFVRYQNFLVLANLYPAEKLYPTVDIELVWKSHLIRPASYRKDTMAMFGRVYEHTESWKPRSYRERQRLLERTKELYEKEFNQPYIPSYLKSTTTSDKKDDKQVLAILSEGMLSLDFEELKKDAMWLPNLREYMKDIMVGVKTDNPLDEQFLDRSLKEYEDFLASRKDVLEGSTAPGPGYNVDIFWHAHMMHPVEYQQDCLTLVGKVVLHDPWPSSEFSY